MFSLLLLYIVCHVIAGRDICNGGGDSSGAGTGVDYPFARHKDLFDGHSWARYCTSEEYSVIITIQYYKPLSLCPACLYLYSPPRHHRVTTASPLTNCCSGLFAQGNGKSQESSSEAVNAYHACHLYAEATGRKGGRGKEGVTSEWLRQVIYDDEEWCVHRYISCGV